MESVSTLSDGFLVPVGLREESPGRVTGSQLDCLGAAGSLGVVCLGAVCRLEESGCLVSSEGPVEVIYLVSVTVRL